MCARSAVGTTRSPFSESTRSRGGVPGLARCPFLQNLAPASDPREQGSRTTSGSRSASLRRAGRTEKPSRLPCPRFPNTASALERAPKLRRLGDVSIVELVGECFERRELLWRRWSPRLNERGRRALAGPQPLSCVRHGRGGVSQPVAAGGKTSDSVSPSWVRFGAMHGVTAATRAWCAR